MSGDIVGNRGIKFIEDLPIFREPSGRIRRFCKFQCECGNFFSSRLSDVLSNNRTSCGCKKGNHSKIYKKGEIINGITFIKSTGVKNDAQRALFECPICKKQWESLIGNIQAGNTKSCCKVKRGWSRSQWINLSPVSTLYKVELFNENESFIKFGITTKSINQRFKKIPYNYKVIKTVQGESGYIYNLENRVKRILKKYKYSPKIRFRGEGECFVKQ